MRLFELFDKKADWEWVESSLSDVSAAAVIMIDGERYEVAIAEDDADNLIAGLERHGEPIPEWLQMLSDDVEQQLYNIVFYHQSKKLGMNYELTGLGNAYILFSTIIDIMNEYGKEFNVDWWTFSAKEANRRSMYDRLASRFSGEVFTIDDMDGDKMYVVKA